MRNRIKLFWVIGAVFLLATAVTYTATTNLIQAQYAKIEQADTVKNTARAVDALHNRIDQLKFKITDWSSWDDTYAFIVNHNKAYLESNVQNGSLQNLGINFMLFYNAKQQLVSSKAVDVETGEDMTMPPELLAAFAPGSQLLAKDETSSHQGFIKSATGPIFLVSQPILTTDGDGPMRGTLVFAQYLSAREIAKLAALTHLELNYYALYGAAMPDDTKAVAGGLVPGVAQVRALTAQRIAGYQLVQDIYDRPLLVARVELPRDIFVEAGRTLNFYLVVIMVVTLVSIVVTLYTTSQIVKRDRTIQLKNEFFSIASHDLRTPLGAIRGNSELIKTHYGPKNDQALSELADDIHQASVRLIKMVTNFLDAARLEQGQLPLSPRPMSVGKVVEAVISDMRAVAAEKHLYLKADVPQDLPDVLADPERVQQVVYNLVGNAMKFTDEGGITISAAPRNDIVTIFVTDTGRGIPKDGQKALFERFGQARATDAQTGSGLGLYISRMLLEKMDGRIGLEASEVGRGTTLSFALPVAKGQAAPDDESAGSELTGPKSTA